MKRCFIVIPPRSRVPASRVWITDFCESIILRFRLIQRMPKKRGMNSEDAIKECRQECIRPPPSAPPSMVEERTFDPPSAIPFPTAGSATLRYRQAPPLRSSRSATPRYRRAPPPPVGRGAPSERSEHDASRDHRTPTPQPGRTTNTTSTAADHRPRKTRFSARFRGSYIRTGPAPSTGSPRLEAPRLAARHTSTTGGKGRPYTRTEHDPPCPLVEERRASAPSTTRLETTAT